MKLVLFEDKGVKNFYPLVYSRPFVDLFFGTSRIKDKIERKIGESVEIKFLYREYLKDLFKEKYPYYERKESIFINARVKDWSKIKKVVEELYSNKEENILFLSKDGTWLGFVYGGNFDMDDEIGSHIPISFSKKIETDIELWNYPWEIVAENKNFLEDEINVNYGEKLENGIYLGQNVSIGNNVVLDSSKGPIVLENNSIVMHNVILEGPLYIGRKSVVKPLSYISKSSIGDVCKIGGEVSGVIMIGYSNKQHGGFLGDMYVGEWVNIGAGTNNSNLKNTYSKIKVEIKGVKIDTGLTFFGGIIGDHAKVAIGMRLNTGTIIGFSANIFDNKVPPRFIPSFSWGDEDTFKVDKAIDVASTMMKRRDVELNEVHKALFYKIYELSEWERK